MMKSWSLSWAVLFWLLMSYYEILLGESNLNLDDQA